MQELAVPCEAELGLPVCGGRQPEVFRNTRKILKPLGVQKQSSSSGCRSIPNVHFLIQYGVGTCAVALPARLSPPGQKI